MSVKIRLTRIGKRGQASYRIAAFDKTRKRNAKYLDNLGFYDPLATPPKLVIDGKRFKVWIAQGAQVSETVAKLFRKSL